MRKNPLNSNSKIDKLEKNYQELCSDFSLEVVDKTLVNMFEGYLDIND